MREMTRCLVPWVVLAVWLAAILWAAMGCSTPQPQCLLIIEDEVYEVPMNVCAEVIET